MRTHLSLLASLAAITSLVAQEEPAVAVPVVPAEPVVSVEAAPPVGIAPPSVASEDLPMIVGEEPVATGAIKSKDTLSVDFPDEEIRTILRNVADLFELNLVIPDTLQGRTSLKLREVTWRQIFQVILSPVGYTFVEDGNIIKIVSLAALAEEPLATEIFIINYAKAADIKNSIDSIVDASVGGKVIVDTRSNGLVITERSSRIGRIRPIIEKLDRATDQVMIESKFIEISVENEKSLGLDWTLAGGSSGSAYASSEKGSVPVSPGTTVTGTPIAPGNSFNITTSMLSGADYTAILRAAETKGNARVVNNPTLVTLNNVQAEINIGEEYPIPSYTYNAERGAFEVSGFEYKPIGVLLKVTPQINSQGFIKLTLEPEISQRDPIPVNFGGAGGAEIPIINTRKTKTQVSLQDGHTLGIGGLIKDEENKNVSQLPILGSIPGIGRLFQNKNNQTIRTNLLIFITARVISPKDAKPEEIYDPRVLRDAKLKRSDITGYREAGDPFLPETPLIGAPQAERK
jgi:type IV pilus assembly protein PilQ